KAFVQESRLTEILQKCADAVVRRLGAAFVRVWVLNASDNMLEPRAGAGAGADAGDAYGRVPVGGRGIGRIASKRKPYHTNSIRGDSRTPDPDWAIKEKMTAFAGFPLIVGEKLVGVIALLSGNSLSEAVLEALASVSDQIAIGIARGRSDEALRESEERFREMAELLPEVVFEADASGRLTFANKNAFEYFGYSQQEMKEGMHCFDFIAPEDHPKAREIIERLINGESIDAAEYRAIRKSGSTFPAMTQTTLIRRGGEITGFRGLLVDVTEKKRIELQLRQAQKMEAIGTLAGGVAHDFNNILSAIMGYAEISLLDADENTPFYPHLKKIMKAGERARDLVKQILTFSRKTERELTPIQVSAITKEVLKLLRASLPATIEINHDLGSDAGVMADPTQIHQVLMNLCTNAGHAMREEGGVLEVTLKEVDLDADFVAHYPELTPGPYIELSVSDTGHGMTSAVQERIFDPFFTTKKLGEGTGMGLSVVHGIVKSHGGEITVNSQPGEGSVFHVFLPIIKRGELKKKTRPPALPTGKERVLYVDDEEFQVDIAKQMLTRLGYEATTRVSGVEALALFRERPDRFDIVITDMTMPAMTGDVFARELMKIRPGIPIILCTGFNENISEAKAREIGIRGFIMKPIVMQKIAEAIREAVANP
ncbi:MAG: PAS domain S-box protein, partial [Desulfobacterales bacterium]|nr:PAS domain S-box protein [Desulfobacterales bacterium]